MRSIITVLALLVAMAPAVRADSDPALSVPSDTLDAALTCPASFTRPNDPVLLVHGTAVTDHEHWGWNYADVLPDLGHDVCMVRLPKRSMGDIQIASEYVVHAVRSIHARTERPIDVMGHSQGAIEPRWAVRWWPSIRPMIDDMVLLAGPNHGTVVADGACPGACAPAVQQMKTTSKFMAALNSADETPGDISYTSVASDFDELVQPSSTTVLDGASNILVQDLCPGRPVHHVGQNHDAIVYGIVMDALQNPGPADVDRFFESSACLETTMPGANETDAAAGNLLVYGNGFPTFGTAETADEEPPLADYAS